MRNRWIVHAGDPGDGIALQPGDSQRRRPEVQSGPNLKLRRRLTSNEARRSRGPTRRSVLLIASADNLWLGRQLTSMRRTKLVPAKARGVLTVGWWAQ